VATNRPLHPTKRRQRSRLNRERGDSALAGERLSVSMKEMA